MGWQPRILGHPAADVQAGAPPLCPTVEEVHVITCFVARREPDGADRVLIVRRSRRVGSYQGRWSGVSGYLEEPTALQQAYRELGEETGLRAQDVELVREGEPLPVADPALGRCWVVHPFLFRLTGDAPITLDWENVESRWIPPQELSTYETVPGLVEALARVYP